MKRHYNGRYRIDYFQKLFPVLLMFWTAVAGLGFKTSNIIVEAWGDTPVDHAEKVQISPTPTPQLAVIEPTIMPTATPTPTPVLVTIEEKIREAFGDEAEIAIAVAKSESGLIPTRTLIASAGWHTWSSPTYKGECSIGLFMINLAEDGCNGRWIHASKIPGETLAEKMEWLKVPENNIKFAKQLHDDWGGFNPWSGYTGGGYKKHL